MRRLIALFAALLSVPAAAQTVPSYNYPSAGTPPSVILQCSDTYTACLPTTSSNPLKTSGGGTGGSNQVEGNSASGAADTGNPVKIGGLVNTTTPTAATTGQRDDFWSTAYGALEVAGITVSGADGIANNVLRSISGQNTVAVGPLFIANSHFNGTTWDRMRGDTTGTYMVQKGTASLATGQISAGTTSTLIAAARAGRSKITLAVGAANACAFGNTGVTTTTGFPLQPVAGASLVLTTSAAVYAACSATTTVGYIEEF
jgi:hypothetical protein